MTINKRIVAWPVLAGIAITLSMSSCLKQYDAASYAPSKPFGGYSSSKEIASNNLVAYWAFNGGLVDSAGGPAGTSVGTTFVAGEKGQALQLGGSNYLLFNSPPAAITGLKAF